MVSVKVMSIGGVVYEGEARSVFFPGATGEFEVLEFHKAIISLLKEGEIIINWEKKIPIKKGVMRMKKDEVVCVVRIERGKRWH